METINNTIIRFNKKYLRIITSYLQTNHYYFEVGNDNGNKSKIQLEIKNLNPEDAFYLGVKTQGQLADGEFLI